MVEVALIQGYKCTLYRQIFYIKYMMILINNNSPAELILFDECDKITVRKLNNTDRQYFILQFEYF